VFRELLRAEKEGSQQMSSALPVRSAVDAAIVVYKTIYKVSPMNTLAKQFKPAAARAAEQVFKDAKPTVDIAVAAFEAAIKAAMAVLP
jgi:hypothetical protein